MTLHHQLLTLLFLEAAGLQRTWDLRSYTGQALALLTGRQIAYGYCHTERFLAELAQVGADEPLTQALASWTASLWKQPPGETESSVPDGKVRSLDIDTGSELYLKADVDAYIVDTKRGRKPKQVEETI